MDLFLQLLSLLPLLAILALTWTIWTFISAYIKNLAPGPYGLPIVGYAPFLGKKLHVTLANLRQKYGDVFSINLFAQPTLVLSSSKVLKEAFVKQSDVFSARPVSLISPPYRSTPGVSSSNGEMWSELRRFSLSTLRQFGIGKSSIEPKIIDEIDYFVKEIEKFKETPVCIEKLLHRSITNVICIILTGERFSYNDKNFHKLLEIMAEHTDLLRPDALEFLLPEALVIPKLFKMLGIRTFMETTKEAFEFLSGIVEKCKQQYQPGDHENFIAAWFTESAKENGKKKYINRSHLSMCLFELFLGGSETSTYSLTWALLYMAKHQEIQTKVQLEIDNVIGRERTPTMADQKLMPYTEATLMETSRIASLAALGAPHSTVRDTNLNGYFIPAKICVIPNLWAIHHDPDVFPQPDHFKPERFLTENRQIKRIEDLMPFSIGKRQCLGEPLARMELFLYFTSMLQHFTFKKVDGTEIDFDCDFTTILKPNKQNLIAIKR